MKRTFSMATRLLGAAFAVQVAAVLGAAEVKHDMYLCLNLSGQGQVMGTGKAVIRSGLYRSTDRQEFQHLGFNHIRVFGAAADLRDPRTLFVTTLDGVIRAGEGGTKWRRVTSWDMTEPKGIAFDPNAPNDIYVGLPDGVAVSRDRGETWSRAQEGIRRGYTHPVIVDRTRAGRVLIGTELGLYLTEDAARTWRKVLETEKTVYDIRQSPHDPQSFLAVTSSNGAFRSADAGRTWTRIAGVPTQHTLHNVDFDRADAKRLVIGGWGLGVLVSEDGGANWIDRSAGLPSKEIWRACTDPDFPNRLYAVPHLKPLFVSDDFGRTWRPLAFDGAIAFDILFVPRP
jgi:photosystem II stability/assembly factor-like uncharacterized protein